jgi:hypothetical protein
VTGIFKGDKGYLRILLVIVGGIDDDILVMRKTCCKKQPGIADIGRNGINIGRPEHRIAAKIMEPVEIIYIPVQLAVSRALHFSAISDGKFSLSYREIKG